MKIDRKKLAWFLTNIRHDAEKDNIELTDTDIANHLGTWIERNPGCIDIHGVSDPGRFSYSTVGYGVFSLMGDKYRMGRIEIFDSEDESGYAVSEGIHDAVCCGKPIRRLHGIFANRPSNQHRNRFS
jgi:hypothetical protein